ncbi:HEPN domain-containing protein [Candidatus Borrarchaeum sp.]|uniref:HEPN domain-containing protein n=1 Tax=Candidatus Borrarchaeum sp. TaxID=2846742 RepID=UPI00257E0933|nr:HEPN domain-containing protein [Candidatus Borrarchaeum sp.]
MGIEEAAKLLAEAYKYYMMGRELLAKKDFSVSVQAAQSCIEVAIKSLFSLVDLSYPPLHDSTTKINMILKKLELPERFSLITEGAQRLIFLSKLSKTFHDFSVFGYIDIATSNIFQKRDAVVLIDYAFEAWNICSRIEAAVRSKQIKILK